MRGAELRRTEGASSATVPHATTALDPETIDATTCATDPLGAGTLGTGASTGPSGSRGSTSACERCPD